MADHECCWLIRLTNFPDLTRARAEGHLATVEGLSMLARAGLWGELLQLQKARGT